MRQTARAFSRLLRGSRRWVAASAGVACVQSLALVAVGLLVRRAFDTDIPRDRIGALIGIGAALLALSVLSAGLALSTRRLVLRAVKDAVALLRVRLLERLNTLPAAWHDRVETGTVHSTIVQESERLDVAANALGAVIAPAAVIAAGLSVALAVINLPLFALLAVTLPVFAVLTRRFEGVVSRRTRVWQLAFDRFSTRAHVALRARGLITAQVAEDAELERARAEIEELSAAGRSMAYAQAAYAQLQGAVASVAGIVVLVVGGAAVARGSMSLGSLISFYTLLALLRTQGSVVLGTLPQLMSGRESLRRLDEILDAPDRGPYTGKGSPTLRRGVALRDVHFGYRAGEPVLRGLDLEVERGECVALVGRNGVGKSTVGALLLGLYRPWTGSVEADGAPYDELDIRALRRRIGFVPQAPLLLPGTIGDNVAYGADRPPGAALHDAARAATVDELVAELPRGYETPVGDEGGLLSGGQRQRIAIARALVRRPELLILDEPTSNLDRDAVNAVLANLRELPQRPAILVISHDAAVVEGADRVAVLAGGAVREPAAGSVP